VYRGWFVMLPCTLPSLSLAGNMLPKHLCCLGLCRSTWFCITFCTFCCLSCIRLNYAMPCAAYATLPFVLRFLCCLLRIIHLVCLHLLPYCSSWVRRQCYTANTVPDAVVAFIAVAYCHHDVTIYCAFVTTTRMPYYR
jgi:hypothetical protein